MVSGKIIKFDRTSMVVFIVLFASLMANILIKCGVDFEYLGMSFEQYSFENDIAYSSSIMYIAFTRLKQGILIFLLMKTLNPEVIYNCINIFLGCYFGFLLSVQTFYSGVTGVSLLLLFIFPHYFFYLVLIYLVYRHYKNWSKESLRFPEIMFFLVLCCAGVVCEGFFSRIFLENFYQHIVVKM